MINYDEKTNNVTFYMCEAKHVTGFAKKIEVFAEIVFETKMINNVKTTRVASYNYSDGYNKGNCSRPVTKMPNNKGIDRDYIQKIIKFKSGLQQAFECYKEIASKNDVIAFKRFIVENKCKSEEFLLGFIDYLDER